MATQEYKVGLATVRVHSATGWTLLTPAEQQVEFDRRILDRDPIAVSIADLVTRIFEQIEAS